MRAEGEARHLDLVARHPVAVAADRVDLAIVREAAERLRQPPLREGVGRIALVEDRDAADETIVDEIGIEDRQRFGEEQPLVDDRAARQRADRSEEHTSELQSLMRISYAVFCLKKKNKTAKK